MPPVPRERLESAAAAARQLLRTDPLIARYYGRRQQLPSGEEKFASLSEPWMALAELRLNTAAMLIPEIKIMVRDPPGVDLMTGRMMLATMLNHAEVFLWRTSVLKVALAYPLPDHIISTDLLSFQSAYHTFETVQGLMSAHGVPDDTAETDWTLLCAMPTEEGVEASTMLGVWRNMHLPGAGGQDVVFMSIPLGARYPQDIPEKNREAVGQVLKLLAFLKSPFVTAERHSMPRNLRRHAAKNDPDRDRQVSVVVLRAAARKALEDYEAAGRQHGAEYQHRWWVRGHLRAQWYPSKEAHEVIWIAPYLKGPEGAPVLSKVYSVTR